jgi:hypothetical protein
VRRGQGGPSISCVAKSLYRFRQPRAEQHPQRDRPDELRAANLTDQDLFGTTISLTPSVSWTQFDLNDRSRGRSQKAGVNAAHGSEPRGYPLAAFKRLPRWIDIRAT